MIDEGGVARARDSPADVAPLSRARDLLWICSTLVNNLSQNLPTVIPKSLHLQNGPTKRDSVLELSDDFIFWEL